MKVISNTTVISNFARLEELGFLRALFEEIFISVDVYNEIRAGIEEGYTFYSVTDSLIYPMSQDGWIKLVHLVNDEEMKIFSSLPARLHSGEASSLAIAESRGWLFLTDDKAARKQAKKTGVAVSGTLGCLILGTEKGLVEISQANEWLGRLIAAGFHSPLPTLDRL